MSFKLTSPFAKHATPIVNVPMEENVMGRADKRGTILINKDLKDPKQIEDTINHENVHIKQMASGDLDYDEKNVYFKGKKYPRSKFNEANKQLPWEIEAYKAG
jgi:hypothetical protein|tara:strand:+ start:95 stop:403 length:309 start_codon:yes stop_codon:yes gene_type:complete